MLSTKRDSCFTAINISNPTLPLITDWGPKRDPLYVVVPISVIYILIFVTGVLGNISTCVVIAKNRCMHTATNYYLFSLAISDLLLLVAGLPPEIYYIWSKYPYIFGEEFCVLQGFAAEASANATVLTITAFTVERYVAICYPFFSHTLSKLSRAIKYIIYIWLFAICLAIPQALVFGIVCEVFDDHLVDEHCVCAPKRVIIPYAFEISTVVFFVAPMTLITVLYMRIGIQLQKSMRPSRGNGVKLSNVCYRSVNFGVNHVENVKGFCDTNRREEGRNTKNTRASKHVIKMLVAVVVAFFICWAPFHAQRLLAIYGTPTSLLMRNAFQILTYISGLLYYLSTTVNPLLYHIMSHKFRQAFKATYRQCCRKRQNIPGGRCYSSLSVRSSQVNSHSSDSFNQGRSALRYLEQEMRQVVSFKKKRSPSNEPDVHYKRELREALDSFKSSTRFTNSDVYSSQDSCTCASYFDGKRPHSVDVARTVDTRFESDISVRHFRSSREIETHKTELFSTDFDRQTYLEPEDNFRFMEVHNLQPTHVCPLNRNIFL